MPLDSRKDATSGIDDDLLVNVFKQLPFMDRWDRRARVAGSEPLWIISAVRFHFPASVLCCFQHKGKLDCRFAWGKPQACRRVVRGGGLPLTTFGAMEWSADLVTRLLKGSSPQKPIKGCCFVTVIYRGETRISFTLSMKCPLTGFGCLSY
jgi:hypothetical protein